MATTLKANPHLVRLKLPFSVIQMWNDLEIGQVVKLPAKDNRDDAITMLAHRDGDETISLAFTKGLQDVVGEVFAAEVTIVKVEQTIIDSSSTSKRSISNNTSSQKPIVINTKDSGETEIGGLSMECEETDDEYNVMNHSSPEEKTGIGTMKLPVVISPRTNGSTDTPKRRISESSSEDGAKKCRGERKYDCNICGAVFIYYTSYGKHMRKHGKYLSKGKPAPLPPPRTNVKVDPPKLPRLLPKMDSTESSQNTHHMVTRKHTPVTTSNENKSPKPVPLKVPQVPLPRPLSPPNNAITVPVTQNPLTVVSMTTHVPIGSVIPITNHIPISIASMTSPIQISPAVSLNPGLTVSNAVSIAPKLPITISSPVTIAPASMVQVTAPVQLNVPQPNVRLLSTSTSQDDQADRPLGPMEASRKPPPHVRQGANNILYMRPEDPLDCWVCLRQFKYPTSFLKHMRIEHEITLKIDDHFDRRKRSHKKEQTGQEILNTLNPNVESSSSLDDDFRGHQSGQVVALQMKPNGEYVVVDSDMNEIVLGEYLLCSICLTSFNYKEEYIKHMLKSHGVLVKDMTEEVQEHSQGENTEVFQCHVCNKEFFYRLPYEQHLKQIHNINMVVMEGEKSNDTYACPMCSMVFLYQTSFERHMKKDHGIDMTPDTDGSEDSPQARDILDNTVFRCNLCLSWFKDADDLENHVATEHGDDKPEPERVKDPDSQLSLIQCDYCSKTFKFRIAYSKHLRVAHKDKVDENNENSPKESIDSDNIKKETSDEDDANSCDELETDIPDEVEESMEDQDVNSSVQVDYSQWLSESRVNSKNDSVNDESVKNSKGASAKLCNKLQDNSFNESKAGPDKTSIVESVNGNESQKQKVDNDSVDDECALSGDEKSQEEISEHEHNISKEAEAS